ncbi:hypothetical protein LJC27_00590 [Christensenellaceae bacterium OttesenSCG-928-M15]|nr:hypothetical protein [Christensenellaceae bacterium OttesenSCG-928-M15]
MTVNLKLLCYDMADKMSSVQPVTLHEGATIEEAIDEYFNGAGKAYKHVPLKESVFMRNSMAARLDTVLMDGDNVLIIRNMIGG